MVALLQVKATKELVFPTHRNGSGGVYVTFRTGTLRGRSTWFRETDLETRCACVRCNGDAHCAECKRPMSHNEVGDELPEERICDACAAGPGEST